MTCKWNMKNNSDKATRQGGKRCDSHDLVAVVAAPLNVDVVLINGPIMVQALLSCCLVNLRNNIRSSVVRRDVRLKAATAKSASLIIQIVVKEH